MRAAKRKAGGEDQGSEEAGAESARMQFFTLMLRTGNSI
jgi:hypothetical protein